MRIEDEDEDGDQDEDPVKKATKTLQCSMYDVEGMSKFTRLYLAPLLLENPSAISPFAPHTLLR